MKATMNREYLNQVRMEVPSDSEGVDHLAAGESSLDGVRHANLLVGSTTGFPARPTGHVPKNVHRKRR
jgi:hypothetical protein